LKWFVPGGNDLTNDPPVKATAREVAAILEKISSSDRYSLTEKERDILRKAAKK
jgi:hypothetical protein